MELTTKDILKIIELNENPPEPTKELIKAMEDYLKKKDDIIAMKNNDYDGI